MHRYVPRLPRHASKQEPGHEYGEYCEPREATQIAVQRLRSGLGGSRVNRDFVD